LRTEQQIHWIGQLFCEIHHSSIISVPAARESTKKPPHS
jgi:hypothetical protein